MKKTLVALAVIVMTLGSAGAASAVNSDPRMTKESKPSSETCQNGETTTTTGTYYNSDGSTTYVTNEYKCENGKWVFVRATVIRSGGGTFRG